MREQGMFDPARLVFIDETSTNTAMVRLRGRCPRGIRLIDHVPHGHWKTITFIAGLRRRAMVAPFVLDGPMNTTSFMAYLKRCLIPTLKRGDIVMMDSLPVHKVAGVRELIEAAGARLRYLPKYSPDLNPIEQAFSKLKAHLRKAAERTIPRLSRRIGALMAKFSSQECDNYFRHAGYASACPVPPQRNAHIRLMRHQKSTHGEIDRILHQTTSSTFTAAESRTHELASGHSRVDF